MKCFVSIALAAAVLCASGCHLFSKKKPKPKEDSHLATDVETEFMQRWVEKRSNELIAQGVAPAAARNQAMDEFREKYSQTHPAAAGGVPAK